jgi:predicted phosphate transport protein (TIGR00153 family)
MMLKKEREVIFLVERHLDEVKEWLQASSEALGSYLAEDFEKIRYLLLKKNETNASLKAECQQIWDRLCKGAYFPVIRADLLGIVKSVDKIADAATLSCETFVCLQPEIPLKIKNQLETMVRLVFLLFRPIHESVLYYLRGDDVQKVIRKNVGQFLEKSFEIVTLESNLKNQIYTSNLDPWQKSYLKDCLESIGGVCSRASEANDKIQMIMMNIIS